MSRSIALCAITASIVNAATYSSTHRIQSEPTCTVTLPLLGCFDDSKGPHALPNLLFSSNSMTLDVCANSCALVGFPLAAVTGHSTPSPQQWSCYCGDGYAPGSVPAPC